nr:uncharacterized protein LOC119187112 isoform X1 [Rhipicephalus microplus]
METPHLPSPDDCNVIGEAEPTVGLFVHQDADELCKSGAPLVQHTEERDENLDLGLSERHCDEEAPSLDSSSLGNAGRVLENVNNPMNGVEEFAVCQDKHETVSSMPFTSLGLAVELEHVLPEEGNSATNNSSKKKRKRPGKRTCLRKGSRKGKKTGGPNDSSGVPFSLSVLSSLYNEKHQMC